MALSKRQVDLHGVRCFERQCLLTTAKELAGRGSLGSNVAGSSSANLRGSFCNESGS